MGYKISELKGVPAALAKSLEALGYVDTDELLLAMADSDVMKATAAKLGISEQVLSGLVNRSDLLRVPGIGPAYTDLLNAAGINSVSDLRAAGPGLSDQLTTAATTLGLKGVPKPAEVATWVTSAKTMEDASDWAITTKSAALRSHFAGDEWTKVKLAPLAAAALVVAASPSEKKETSVELTAAAGAVNSARASARPEALLNVAFPADVTADEIAKFMGETPPAAMLSTITAATDLVRRSADADQLAAYQQMIVSVAQHAAEAAKEGGFLGMGKKLVSEEEQAALDEIHAAIGI